MKTRMLFLIALVATIALASNASAELVTSGTSLEASLLYYTPVPAQPGDLLDVWIQVSNEGGTESKAGTVTVLESYPFTVPSDSERVKEFTAIPAQQNLLVKTKVRIDKAANEGTNYVTVKVQEKGSENWIEKDLAITIQGKSSALTINSATTSPEMITPGKEGVLTLDVKNTGLTKVRNLDVALDLTDLSLAPKEGSASKTIDVLKGGENETFTFALQAYPDATAQVLQVPVTLSYEDEEGNTESQSETLGVAIGSAPELLVYFERINAYAETKSGDVVIKLVNKGLNEIKLLELEVLENDNVTVTSESPLVYVGNIDADDYESATLTLKLSNKEVIVPVRIAYRDALNNEYEEIRELPLVLPHKNGNGSTNWFVWLLLIVVAGGLFWWWRKRKAKKSKHK